jgi:hypothetical protein
VLSANATAAEDLGARTAFAVNLAATRLGVDSSTIITR